MTDHSGNPLTKKLGIKPGNRLLALGAPADYVELLDPLPVDVRFVSRLSASTDVVHAFATRRAELGKLLKRFRTGMNPNAVVWVSWPKKSSGVATDVTEDTVRELALPLGFVDVKVCAVDAVWSGLKLVIRKELR